MGWLKELFRGPLQSEYKRKLQETLSRYDDSYRFFFVPQGLGDVLFFCMYAHAYRQKNPGVSVALIVTKPHIGALAEIFKDNLDLILQIDENYYRMGDTHRFTYLYPRIYDASAPQNNLAEAVRNAMGLPKNARRYIPEIEKNPNLMQRILKTENKTRVALIASDANSCNVMLSDQEWVLVAEMLKKNGYTVVFNTQNGGRFPGFKSVFLSVKETIQFCNECALFIGYRSGMCDVIAAFCRCKQVVMYPNDRKAGEFDCVVGYDDNPNQRYMEYCSLKSIFPDADVREFIFSEDEYMQRMEKCIYG